MSDTLVIFEEWENLREKGFQKKFKFLKKVLDKQEIVWYYVKAALTDSKPFPSKEAFSLGEIKNQNLDNLIMKQPWNFQKKSFKERVRDHTPLKQ